MNILPYLDDFVQLTNKWFDSEKSEVIEYGGAYGQDYYRNNNMKYFNHFEILKKIKK